MRPFEDPEAYGKQATIQERQENSRQVYVTGQKKRSTEQFGFAVPADVTVTIHFDPAVPAPSSK